MKTQQQHNLKKVKFIIIKKRFDYIIGTLITFLTTKNRLTGLTKVIKIKKFKYNNNVLVCKKIKTSWK